MRQIEIYKAGTINFIYKLEHRKELQNEFFY